MKLPSYDQIFVGGRWQDATGGGRIDVVSPQSEEVIAHAAAGSAEDVDRAVRAARAAFDDGPWPRLSHAERIAAVERFAAVYATHIDDMADLITAEMGSPASFSRLGQAAGAASMMHLAVEAARKFPWVERRGGMFGEVHLRRPAVGVVGIIIPWNVPQNLLMPKLIPALIAGCTVVVKPAPETPLDTLWVAEMIEQIGLPEGVVSVVPGGREVGEELVRHPGVDKIAFTGSSATGRHIASLCGEQLKRVSLELGGKSAAIVLDDAHIGKTVAGLKMAALMNNGQACVAQTRILVSERRHDEFVAALAEMMSGLVIGDPADPDTDEDDAVRIANDSDYGLAGSVWTKDVAHGLEISGRVRTGTYGINMYMLDISSPFGGFKQSGIGREFAEEGLAEYTELQSVVSARKLPDLNAD